MLNSNDINTIIGIIESMSNEKVDIEKQIATHLKKRRISLNIGQLTNLRNEISKMVPQVLGFKIRSQRSDVLINLLVYHLLKLEKDEIETIEKGV